MDCGGDGVVELALKALFLLYFPPLMYSCVSFSKSTAEIIENLHCSPAIQKKLLTNRTRDP